MKSRIFSSDNGIDFYAELRSRADQYFQSNGISRTGNGLMKFKIAFCLILVVATYSLLLMSPSIGYFALFYLFFGISVLLVFFNVAHDAAHGVAVKNKRVNKILFLISFQFLGQNPFLWGKNHTESHHMYPNVEESDVDVLNVFGMRVTESAELKWFHRYQFLYVPLYYMFYSINWLFFRNILSLFNYTARTISTKISTKEMAWLLFFKASFFFYMLILPILILPFSWSSILLVFLGCQLIVSLAVLSVLIISHLSDYVEHPTPDETNSLNLSWAKMQLTTCIDYGVDSRFFRWTLGGFNTHAVHHLFPDVCHVHHRALIPIVRELAEKHGIPYIEISYAEAVRSHFRFLKKMGTSTPNIPIAYSKS
ncbi:MAG: acyl-CoA desaturase [Crocinitomicaceae bacterium]|nr:acyl-CoA desaturase [Flavobacteriales bacterium]NQZ37000.1 acyl-CoA desaturase [Crocinitomicaceae bacterium]